MTYLHTAKNLDELKAQYKKAAMKLHPDMGGTTEAMQALNAEYEARFETLKHTHNETAAADTTGKTHATTEAPSDFINIITALMKLEGLDIELCGRWLWIGGNTKEHKEALKGAGCRWSNNKKLWSWHFAADSTYHGKKGTSMANIRSKYGSQRYNRGNSEPLLA